MKTILQQISTSVRATLLFTVVLCGFYPVVVWGLSELFFPHQANGSLIENADRKIIGSEWLGQNFTSPKYFHPRPSAAGSGYDASSSSGTNLGPTSQKLIDSVKAAIAQYRTDNNLPTTTLIPGDAVTSSASGLDPHISPKNALLQAPRVARERSLKLTTVFAQIQNATSYPSLGILGDPGVNVLKLNLALDKITPQK